MVSPLPMLIATFALAVPAPKEPEPDSYGKGYVGVSLRENENGVVIFKIVPGSPAGRSSLKEEDVIVKIDDQPIRDISDATMAIQRIRPGNPMTIEIKRGGVPMTIRFKAGSRPDSSP